MKTSHSKNIDEYIAGFPEDVRQLLEEMRSMIQKTAPKAEETIKYGIPTFVFNGNLVHFAAYKNHIGFYPAPTEVAEFKKAISPYEAGKGTLRFPLDRRLPLALIGKIVKYRVKKNSEKAKSKVKKK